MDYLSRCALILAIMFTWPEIGIRSPIWTACSPIHPI